jgi:acetyltransferase
VLADAWQGRGLGTELLGALVDMARLEGVQRLAGTTLSTNAAAIALMRRVGFRTRRDPASAVFTLAELSLSPAPTAPAAS